MQAPSFLPDPALYPFESRWFDATAGRMHYVDEGPRDGPAIVMCHGNPTWSFLYREIITALSDRFRCVAPDLLGMGLSERPAGFSYAIADHSRSLTELVDGLELDDFVVMGQDWGGPTGLGMAVERAERVRGLVLGSTWCWYDDKTIFRLWSTLAPKPPMRQILRRTNLLTRFFVPRLTARDLRPGELDHYTGVQATPDLRVLAGTEFPRQVTGAKATLERLERGVIDRLAGKPALIVNAERDPLFKQPQRERLAGLFADRVVLDLPEASHYFQHDAPDAVADAISRRFT